MSVRMGWGRWFPVRDLRQRYAAIPLQRVGILMSSNGHYQMYHYEGGCRQLVSLRLPVLEWLFVPAFRMCRNCMMKYKATLDGGVDV